MAEWLLLCGATGAGAWAGAKGSNETAHFKGIAGKLRLAGALLSGDLQALRLAPRILRKRREMRKLSKLTPRQMRELLLSNRISLSELTR